MSKKRTVKPKGLKGNQLRAMREKAGLSVSAMGKVLGKNYSTLSKMELYVGPDHPGYKLYWHAYNSVVSSN